MLGGVVYALIAGLMWGLVFVCPLLMPEYPPVMLSAGRYLAFGLIALPLGWLDRRRLSQLSLDDWSEALKLAAVGNLLYYFCLASAIQRAGGPLPTVIIGTLPVVIAIVGNLRNAQRDGVLPWRRLSWPLLVIALGIGCVNATEFGSQHGGVATTALPRYLSGIAFAFGALVCWTWYPLRNADWLRHHPGRSPRTWATAQGLATLPLALIGYGGFWLWSHFADVRLAMPFGPRPGSFVGLMLAIGLLASWLGTLCWNEASQRLPTAIAGQLIVFETLAALSYAYLLRSQWPAPVALTGIGLLVLGVLMAVRVRPVQRPVSLSAAGE